jgi:threonine/homoserine/homoserine lactone efflux protein
MWGVSDYGAFVLAFVLLLFLPGPGNLALVSATGLGGLRGGLASIAGLLLGDQILMWLTVVGVAAMLQANPALFTGLQWLGAAYLTWMGWRMIRSGDGVNSPLRVRPGRYLTDTLMITVMNPKSAMFYFAFFPQFIDPKQHQGLLTFGFMAITVMALGFIYCLGVVLITHTMAQRLRAKPGLTLWLRRAAGLCLMGFGLRWWWGV